MSWAELAEASIAQAHKSRLLPTWLAGRAPERLPEALGRLVVMTRRLSEAVAAVSGRPVVLDSTKTASRGLFLLKYLPEARLIHIVRDPRSVVASHRWRLPSGSTYLAKRRLYRGPLAALALVEATVMWLAGNFLCELVARVDPGRVARLRYEDLRDRPVAEIRRLGTALGLDLEDVVSRFERGEAFPAGHMIGGNDVRLEGKVRFDPGKEASREQLPRLLEGLTVLCCWPLMLRYGYPLRRSRPRRPAGRRWPAGKGRHEAVDPAPGAAAARAPGAMRATLAATRPRPTFGTPVVRLVRLAFHHLLSFEAAFALFVYSNTIKALLPSLPVDETLVFGLLTVAAGGIVVLRQGIYIRGLPAVAAALAFIAWVLVSWAWTPSEVNAKSIVTFMLIFELPCLVLATAILASSRERTIRFLAFLLIIACGLALFGWFIQLAFGSFRMYRGFAGFHRNYLVWGYGVADGAIIAFALMVASRTFSRRQIFAAGLVGLCGGFLLIGSGRGPLLGFVLACLLALVVGMPQLGRGQLRVPSWQLVSLGVLLLAGLYVFYLVSIGVKLPTFHYFFQLLRQLDEAEEIAEPGRRQPVRDLRRRDQVLAGGAGGRQRRRQLLDHAARRGAAGLVPAQHDPRDPLLAGPGRAGPVPRLHLGRGARCGPRPPAHRSVAAVHRHAARRPDAEGDGQRQYQQSRARIPVARAAGPAPAAGPRAGHARAGRSPTAPAERDAPCAPRAMTDARLVGGLEPLSSRAPQARPVSPS